MAGVTTGTYEVDPISRIEGHLGVKVHVDGSGIIDEADAHGNLWRGFENFLLGREANDAITFTQRICGVCPVPHGMTSTYAVDSVFGYSEGHITFAYDAGDGYGVPEKAVLIRNLVLAAEFLMSSITHFYHLTAPSYIQGPAMPPWTPYFSNANYNTLLTNTVAGTGGVTETEVPSRAVPDQTDGFFSDNLWSAVILSYVKALRARRLTFEAGALFAGRMPMTSCFVGGGVTNDGTENLEVRCAKYRTVLGEVGMFIVTDYVPIALALGLLYPNYDNLANATLTNSVIPYHLKPSSLWTIAGNSTGPIAGNTRYGAGCKNMLSWGAFPGVDGAGTLALPGGFYSGDVPTEGTYGFKAANKADIKTQFLTSTSANFMEDGLTEDIANSRYAIDTNFDSAAYSAGGTATDAYPGDVARTKPDRSAADSYIKAPRWRGNACEVGPLARLCVADLYVPDEATTLATTLPTHFGLYLSDVTGGGTSGLNPKAVSADVAVALVRTGLAKLYLHSTGTTYSIETGVGDSLPPSGQALKDAYEDSTAEIRGWIYTWITSVVGGFSTMDRLRARAIESVYLVVEMLGLPDLDAGTFPSGGWLGDLADRTGSGSSADDTEGSTWRNKGVPVTEQIGYGATEAPRGALAHFTTIAGGKITKYQCVVPTTWNGSPSLGSPGAGVIAGRGAIEAACMGVPFDDAGGRFAPKGFASGNYTTTVGGVEVLRVAQSFDPCIACAIH